MTCKYCQPTEDRWFYGPTNKTYFACRCLIYRCYNAARVPPNVPPLDRAGINSRVRYDENGNIQTDFILVRSKFCNQKNCLNFEGAEQ